MQVKICGITCPEDIAIVNAEKPDYVGFVFHPTPREVNKKRAQDLIAQLAPGIATVAVMVNKPTEFAADLGNTTVDVLQLHGDEDADYIRQLRVQTRARIMKVFRLREGVTDYAERIVAAEAAGADMFLFDTYKKDEYGGTGKRFDLSLLTGLKLRKPFFIAGGLAPENLAEVIRAVRSAPLAQNFYGVDVSGGVAVNGRKDANKIHEFIRIAKNT